MARVLIARFGRLLATLFAVTFLSFMLTSLLPGDPAVAILGQDGIQNEELLNQVREDLGLDRPIPTRYLEWLGNAVTLDLGESYINEGQDVWEDVIVARFPVTAQLAVMAIGIAVLLAVPIGILGAYKEDAKDWERINDWIDRVGWPRCFELTGLPFTKYHIDNWRGSRKSLNASSYIRL